MKKILKIVLLLLPLLAATVGLHSAEPTKDMEIKNNVPKRVIISKEFIQVNSRDTIKVEVIKFPLLTNEQQSFIERQIAKYRSPHIMKFIDTFSRRDGVDIALQQDMSYLQQWYYEVVYQSDTELAFKLLRYEFTGGAHGNTIVKNFNFDIVNMRDIVFTEKFKALNLDKVAAYCTAYCNDKQIPIFDENIKAYPEMLRLWNFTGEGLLITFPQYTIAPYSSGIIEVYIPRKDLVGLRK